MSELAIGVVYMAAGRDPVSVEWNRILIEKLDREIELLQEQGKDIMLVGDFNGHIGEPASGDRHRVAPDRQGREVKAAWARWGMEMVNRSKKATGKWTRMRGDQKSEIDFVVIQAECAHRINGLTIHENGELGMGSSDHNWMEVKIIHTGGKTALRGQPQKWNIREDTNWVGYRRVLEEKLQAWWREREQLRALVSQLRETQALACGGGDGVRTKTIISPKFQISGI